MKAKQRSVPEPLIPNLAAVARAANVALSTASRALRNSRKISPSTCQRVQAIAGQLGYRTNPYLNVLMTHVRHSRAAPYSSTLAWLDRAESPDSWKSIHVQRMFFSGAVARAEALGFRIERLHCGSVEFTPQRLEGILRARGIHGVFCSADVPNARLLESPIDPTHFAVATVGCRFTRPCLHFSSNDQFASAAAAHRRLRLLGYRRVGFVTKLQHEAIVDFRFSGGYLSVLAADNKQGQVPIYYYRGLERARLQRWVRRHRPDALLVVGDVDGMRIAELLGLKVPEDIAVAVLDWHEGLAGIAGMDQDHGRVGAGAVDLVAGQIRRNEYGIPEHAQGVTVESRWVEGATAPQRQAASAAERAARSCEQRVGSPSAGDVPQGLPQGQASPAAEGNELPIPFVALADGPSSFTASQRPTSQGILSAR